MNIILKKAVEKIKSLDLYEERSITDEYVEVVFFNKDINKWNKIFTEVLGFPKKETGVTPDNQDLLLTEKYGGMREEQTLFKKEFSEGLVIAMFWPWEDGIHTTLKAAVLKK